MSKGSNSPSYRLKRIRGLSGVVHTMLVEGNSEYAVFYAKNDLDVLKAIVVCIDVGLKPKVIVEDHAKISRELRKAVVELGGEVIEDAEGSPWKRVAEAYGEP